jgi:hypothetical protein
MSDTGMIEVTGCAIRERSQWEDIIIRKIILGYKSKSGRTVTYAAETFCYLHTLMSICVRFTVYSTEMCTCKM